MTKAKQSSFVNGDSNQASRKQDLRRQLSLPKKLVEQLGKLPDQQLADQFGLPLETVYRARWENGISVAKIDWTAERIEALGKDSDGKIAKRLGLAVRTVTAKRTALSIPAFGPTHEEKRFDWTKRQVNLLGKSSDAEVARRLGVSTTTIAWKRRSLGIAAFRAGNTKSKIRSKLSRVQISRLGKAPDSVLSREWGLHRHQVALYRQELGIENFVQRSRNQTWTPEIISRLGKEPDSVIANELCIPVKRVSNFRLQKGILLANPKNRSVAKKPKAGRHSNSPQRKPWTASQVSKLGKVSDRVLASELGISHQAIAQVRKRLGILPFTKDKLAIVSLLHLLGLWSAIDSLGWLAV